MMSLVSPERMGSGPSKESVWDYPRPPRVETTEKHLRVTFSGETIAETRRGRRVLETSHPPVYYFPPEDVDLTRLTERPGSSWCEWKGRATYYDVIVGGREAEQAAWTYHDPNDGFEAIRDHVAFYAGAVDACYVDDERVRPQLGDFYGGWITDDVVGPFKGGPDTQGW